MTLSFINYDLKITIGGGDGAKQAFELPTQQVQQLQTM